MRVEADWFYCKLPDGLVVSYVQNGKTFSANLTVNHSINDIKVHASIEALTYADGTTIRVGPGLIWRWAANQ